jgi:flagellar motility protein MotE (MotC chaperone)
MNAIAKYAALGLGGLALATGSFVTFTALSGAPLHEVALLKNFVSEPPAKPEPEPSVAPTSQQQEPSKPLVTGERQPSVKAIEASMGALGAFVLPAPYSTQELDELQRELREGHKTLRERITRLEAREQSLQEWEQSLQARYDELNQIRSMLEKRELELSLREEEAKRDLDSSRSTEEQSWKELAKFFEDGDPADLAKKLASFPPEDAVKILRSLGDERAGELVNALPAEKYHAYLMAYRNQASKPK